MVPEIQSMIDIFFIILDPYLHAYLTNNPKNQNFEIIIIKKNTHGDIIFTHVYQKPLSYDIQFMRHGMQQT